MLRGKAAEYGAVYALRQILDPQVWIVNKLNLNPQPGTIDQDIGITHRRRGLQIIIETKSAVRGSMTTGTKTRKHKVPLFRLHTIFVTIAPVAILHIHDAGIAYSIEIVPAESLLQISSQQKDFYIALPLINGQTSLIRLSNLLVIFSQQWRSFVQSRRRF